MFGCDRRAAIRASSSKSAIASGKAARCGKIRFKATALTKPPGPSRRASRTSAIPPVANRRTTAYKPSLTAQPYASNVPESVLFEQTMQIDAVEAARARRHRDVALVLGEERGHVLALPGENQAVLRF